MKEPPQSGMPFDGFKEECGVFGVRGADSASALAALGLHALQHRGQEAAGVVSLDKGNFYVEKAEGKICDHFTSNDVMSRLPGNSAVGHGRYSTSGAKHLRDIQPLFAEYSFGGMAIAHNGNLTNADELRAKLIKNGAIFQSGMDSEIFTHLVAMSRGERVADRLAEAMHAVRGAYSLVAITRKKMIGARDPYGIRPLVLGRLGDAKVLTSETCALDIIGASFVRDVSPGEVIMIDDNGNEESFYPHEKVSSRFCLFEYVYFSRPDSSAEGLNVYAVRKSIGRELAREAKVECDVVVPVPDSGVPAALGYAQESGVPFDLGIIRNHYVGRTFIEPGERVRHLGVKLKHNANREIVEGKRVILVDDSIVRGTTSRKIVRMVREAGAKEVHMAIASPPTTHSCFYGVDTPDRSGLIAARLSAPEISKFIEADSLTYLTLDGLYRAVGELAGRDPVDPRYCDACFSGDYPVSVRAENEVI